MAAAGMTLTEFAKLVGVSKQAVGQSLRRKLPADLIGKDPKRGWPVILDPQAAVAAWHANTDSVKKRPTEVYQENGRRAWETRRGEDPAPPRDPPRPPPRDDGAAPGPGDASKRPTINESRAITEAYKARMARLDYEERLGKLVPAAEFKVHYAQQVVSARNTMRGIPARAKTMLPHLSASDVQVLQRLIDEALADVADGR